MEDLILPATNTKEENILAIIEFIKQVEREHGLSEDEIVYKYTFGLCWQFASFINRTLKFLFDDKDTELCFRMGNPNYIDHHVYLKFTDKTDRDFYFDVLGKKSYSEMCAFLQSNFWEELDNKGLKRLDEDKAFWDTEYVDKACLEHIVAEKSASVDL